MALTRSFKETVQERALEDEAFRHGLLTEAVNHLLIGDLVMGKALLRDMVNATIGFPALGKALNKSPKSLMRMLSTEGNPKADSLFAVLAALQTHEGVKLETRAA